MKKFKEEKRLCGNCGSHNPYKYPTHMFCSTRYTQNKDPVVDTLWRCHQWTPVSQKCHCVRDALREKNGK
jgi:hypothetical protein